MFGYQKKLHTFVNLVISPKISSVDNILQKAMNRQRSLWWIFLLIFKRNLIFAAFLQIALISLALLAPFVLKNYFELFLVPTFAELNKTLFLSSLGIFAYFFIFITIFYIKQKLFIQWKRQIEFNALDIFAKICCYSLKEQNKIMVKKFSDEEGRFFSDKFKEFPRIYSNLFSIPALLVTFIFIYSIMQKLFFIPIIILLFVFAFQISNRIVILRALKKVAFFIHARSNIIQKVFVYGNRVHLLALENFFIKKVNLFQENSTNLIKGILNRLSAAGLIQYFSGFIIAIPSITIYLFVNQTYSFLTIASLITFFSLIDYFYGNILNFVSRIKDFKNTLQLLSLPIYLENKNSTIGREKILDVSEEINIKTEVSQNKLAFHKAAFIDGNTICLYNINYEQQIGSLSAVIGQKNSGKSAFLAACTGDLNIISGEKKLIQKVEVLPHETLLFDGTLRENIILDREFEGRRYVDVIRACSLENDFNALDDGDETIFDTLGNKFPEYFLRKITLARTLYSKADLYIFDEPFIGLTSNEASVFFHEGIQKILSHSSRIIATNKLEFAALCDEILVMKEGMLIEIGTHKNLLEKSGHYARLHYAAADSRQFGLTSVYQKIGDKISYHKADTPTEFYDFSYFNKTQEVNYIRKLLSSNKFFLKSYFSSPSTLLNLFYLLASQIFMSLAFYTLFSLNLNLVISRNIQIFIFLMCSIFSLVFFFYYQLKNSKNNLDFSNNLEKKVYEVLIKEHKLSENITAKYLEKFSNVKENLFQSFSSIVVRISFLIAGLILFSVSNLTSLLALFSFGIFIAVFLLIKKGAFLKSYFALNNEKKNLSKILFIYIRSLKTNNSFYFREFIYKKILGKINLAIDKNLEKDNVLLSFSQFICIAFLMVAMLSSIYFSINIKHISIDKVVLSFLGMLFVFKAFINVSIDVGTYFQTIPDFEELIDTASRFNKLEQYKFSTSNYWPEKASIRIMALNVVAIKDYPQPIINLDLFIPSGIKFGFILEKGQHKISTLYASILQFVPFESGTIVVDDEDILKLNPFDLRSKFAYISMNSIFPFLTLKENLDPDEVFDDSEIWSVLNRVGVAQSIAVLRNGLNTKIEDLPKHMLWSGETIFFSIAKALLQNNRILLIDNIILTEESELRLIEILLREFATATILLSVHSKSKLLSICNEVGQFEKGILRRVSIDKFDYNQMLNHQVINDYISQN
ncbi:ATP-binding cassette domain-containing protein [Pigmentibacter ruber]|uniref:ATP-binding cassette domain-containing protein n=1 Tax=Pigmentibacter ruber TaxID=2683196 RepID=UPI00131DF221|nr:ATP-binding cassette domain-containing protein [Pigmentibacter ruber]